MVESTPVSLLERLRRDRHDADWTRFDGLYRPLFQRWLAKLHVPESDRDDLISDLLIVVLNKVADFESNGRKGGFRCWLRRILAFRVQEFWRKRAHRPGDHTHAGSAIDDLAVDNHEASKLWDEEHDRYVANRLLHAIRGEFSEHVWQAFEQHALLGRDPKEIAKELGTTVNAVYLARAKVMRRLRAEAAGLIDT
jgi:RNA polymerase sigma factor (sigma-70 family)